MSDNIYNQMVNEAGKSLLAQRNQMENAERQLVKASQEISNLEVLNDENLSELDKLLLQQKCFALRKV